MFKKLMLFLGVLLMASAFAYAEEKCTVSGTVYFQHDSDIYINLVTRESLPNRLKLLPPPFGVYIKLTPEQSKAKRVPFEFEGIPKGNYFILSFQDLNKDGKLDTHPEGWPVEPYGRYKTSEYDLLEWGKVKFMVDKDITGIEVNIE